MSSPAPMEFWRPGRGSGSSGGRPCGPTCDGTPTKPATTRSPTLPFIPVSTLRLAEVWPWLVWPATVAGRASYLGLLPWRVGAGHVAGRPWPAMVTGMPRQLLGWPCCGVEGAVWPRACRRRGNVLSLSCCRVQWRHGGCSLVAGLPAAGLHGCARLAGARIPPLWASPRAAPHGVSAAGIC
jgi:hypothetical protein